MLFELLSVGYLNLIRELNSLKYHFIKRMR